MYDVIVAGGGPAGSTAAHRAARDGLDNPPGKLLAVTASSIYRQRCYHEPIAI